MGGPALVLEISKVDQRLALTSFLKNEENHFEVISQYYLGEFGLQQAARLYIHLIEQ